MKRYNFFYKFMPFIFEIFENMMPKQVDPLSAILALGGGLLGGWGGSQSGGPTTQTVQYLPPQYTPQQQAINNLMYYGILSNLGSAGGQGAGYQDLLNQYIYGVPAERLSGPRTMGEMPSAQNIIQQYETSKEAAAEAEKPYLEQQADIKNILLKPVYETALKLANNNQDILSNPEFQEHAKRAEEELGALTGLTGEDPTIAVRAIATQAVKDSSGEENVLGSEYKGKQIRSLASPGESSNRFSIFKNWKDEIKDTLNSQSFKDTYSMITGTEKPGVTPSPEMVGTTTEIGNQAPATPTGGILENIMDKDWIAKQFALAEEGGKKDIADWYNQAARELEQRGIGQYGGYMGSPYERDVGGILGKRGEMESTLGRELETAKIGMERQNWYDMLNALTGLQTLQSNLQTAQTTPWLGASQQMTNVPWGQTTTQTSPGVGIFPGFIGGTEAGLGLYEMGQNLGFWGQQKQPATSYGAGTTSPVFQLSGTQNLYNQLISGNKR